MAAFNVGRPQVPSGEDEQPVYNTGSQFSHTSSATNRTAYADTKFDENGNPVLDEELDEFGNPITPIGNQGQSGWGSSMNAQQEGDGEKMGLLKLAMQFMGGGGGG